VLPYLAAVAADAWLHDRGRHVPRLERWAHGGLAAAMTLFLASVFLRRTQIAVGALVGFFGLLAWDELAFHRNIGPRERRVHATAWVALAGFLAFWGLTELR
jgi:hypothetical protein